MFLLLAACALPPDEPVGSDVLPTLDGGDMDDPWTDTDDTVVPGGETGDTDETDPLPVEEDPPNLLLNEVMPKNGFSLNVDGSYPDWVELYNASPYTVDLDRVTLTDASGRVWMGIEGAIEPGAYYLVYADDGLGEAHAPFTLDGSGDTLTLAVDGWVTDRMATGELDADISWARFPDGGEWAPTIWTTAGGTNGDTPSDTLDANATMFGLSGVHTVNVELSSANVSALRSNYMSYVEGNITIDGTEMDSVGVRLRGSSTLRTIDQKCSFKIDFNRFEDQRYRGKKKIHLINMVWDAAHIREYMSYYLFREFGVPAIRNSYAWVTLNGTAKGLYLFSEVYDDDFLDDWYGNSDGYLWEPGSGDFTSGGAGWDCEEGACDTSVVTPVRNLLQSTATDANVTAMENVLDLDSVLRMIAMEIAVGQWDGYCSPHNYRVYYNPDTGLMDMQPSSVDLTFDNLGYSWYGHTYFQCGGQVLSWCLSNGSCEARYVDILNELADRLEGDDPRTSFEVEDRLDEIYALIDDYAADDATTGVSGYTYAQHLTDFAYIREYLRNEPSRIREQVATRGF
jgi:hypothetical protein